MSSIVYDRSADTPRSGFAPWRGFLALVLSLAAARDAAAETRTLMRLSDAQLGRMGLERGDIARYALTRHSVI